MAEIYLVPEVLIDKAAQIDSIQADQESMLRTIQSVADEILAHWEGEARDAFLKAFNEKKSSYEALGVDMSVFSAFLRNYVARWEYIDAEEAINFRY